MNETQNRMTTIELYLKRTDKDGLETVTEHRVWDAKLFMSTREAEAEREGGKSTAQRITREDFDKLRAPRSKV